MKHLIIIRHGAYQYASGATSMLTDDGKAQIVNIIGFLERYFVGKRIILASPTAWAKETAEIIGEAFDEPIECNFALSWMDKTDMPARRKETLSFIRNKADQASAEVVVVVTHKDEADNIPYELAKEFFNGDPSSFVKDFPGFGKGDMLLIDMEQKTFGFIENPLQVRL